MSDFIYKRKTVIDSFIKDLRLAGDDDEKKADIITGYIGIGRNNLTRRMNFDRNFRASLTNDDIITLSKNPTVKKLLQSPSLRSLLISKFDFAICKKQFIGQDKFLDPRYDFCDILQHLNRVRIFSLRYNELLSIFRYLNRQINETIESNPGYTQILFDLVYDLTDDQKKELAKKAKEKSCPNISNIILSTLRYGLTKGMDLGTSAGHVGKGTSFKSYRIKRDLKRSSNKMSPAAKSRSIVELCFNINKKKYMKEEIDKDLSQWTTNDIFRVLNSFNSWPLLRRESSYQLLKNNLESFAQKIDLNDPECRMFFIRLSPLQKNDLFKKSIELDNQNVAVTISKFMWPDNRFGHLVRNRNELSPESKLKIIQSFPSDYHKFKALKSLRLKSTFMTFKNKNEAIRVNNGASYSRREKNFEAIADVVTTMKKDSNIIEAINKYFLKDTIFKRYKSFYSNEDYQNTFKISLMRIVLSMKEDVANVISTLGKIQESGIVITDVFNIDLERKLITPTSINIYLEMAKQYKQNPKANAKVFPYISMFRKFFQDIPENYFDEFYKIINVYEEDDIESYILEYASQEFKTSFYEKRFDLLGQLIFSEDPDRDKKIEKIVKNIMENSRDIELINKIIRMPAIEVGYELYSETLKRFVPSLKNYEIHIKPLESGNNWFKIDNKTITISAAFVSLKSFQDVVEGLKGIPDPLEKDKTITIKKEEIAKIKESADEETINSIIESIIKKIDKSETLTEEIKDEIKNSKEKLKELLIVYISDKSDSVTLNIEDIVKNFMDYMNNMHNFKDSMKL